MRNNKAQSTLVFVALFALIAGALIAMSLYLKGAVQGKLKDTSDVFGGGAQYQPGATQKNY